VGGVLVDPFTVRLPGSRVAAAVGRYLGAYGSGYVVESPRFTLTYRPEHGLFKVVFQDSGLIPEVDSLVRRLRGEVVNI